MARKKMIPRIVDSHFIPLSLFVLWWSQFLTSWLLNTTMHGCLYLQLHISRLIYIYIIYIYVNPPRRWCWTWSRAPNRSYVGQPCQWSPLSAKNIDYIYTTDWESIVVHQTMLTQPRLLSKNKWNKPGHPFWNLGSKIKQTRIQSQISNFDGVDSDAPWSWYQSWSNQDTPSGLPPQVEKLGSYSTHNPSRDFRRHFQAPVDCGLKKNSAWPCLNV